MTPEAVRANWEKICDFSNASKTQTIQGTGPSSSVSLARKERRQAVFSVRSSSVSTVPKQILRSWERTWFLLH